jgi:hypothetical protein
MSGVEEAGSAWVRSTRRTGRDWRGFAGEWFRFDAAGRQRGGWKVDKKFANPQPARQRASRRRRLVLSPQEWRLDSWRGSPGFGGLRLGFRSFFSTDLYRSFPGVVE